MKAIIQTGGKQYEVSKGAQLVLERLPGEVGAQVTFDSVLMIQGDTVKIGTPSIVGARVVGKILAQDKAKKVLIYKYKRRKGYHKKQGHRQLQTRIEVQDILV